MTARKKIASATGNREERRNWDRYVAEAMETYSEIVIGDGEVITVHVPSVDTVNALNEAQNKGDLWDQLEVILGDDIERFREVAGGAPVTALSALLKDVLTDLGLVEVAPGN